MHGGKLYNYYLIIFQFPEVCDYHDAIYAVTILDRDRIKTHQTNDMPYTGDGPLNVEVEVRGGMEMNKIYTAVINVTTAVKSTTTEFVFGMAYYYYDNNYNINHFNNFRYQSRITYWKSRAKHKYARLILCNNILC